MDAREINETPEKLEYSKPALREYGNIHMTTRGTGGTNGDGQQGMTRR